MSKSQGSDKPNRFIKVRILGNVIAPLRNCQAPRVPRNAVVPVPLCLISTILYCVNFQGGEKQALRVSSDRSADGDDAKRQADMRQRLRISQRAAQRITL